LTELRVRDLEFGTRMLTVNRAVVEVHPRFHPEGGRFLVKDYPKDREYRRLKLSVQIVAKLKADVNKLGLGRDDLLFKAPADEGPRVRKRRLVADLDSLGLTEPNAAGRRYWHGTMTGYSLGRCRCEHCRAAYARYRAERRASGKDDPRAGRVVDTDGHLSRHWFRTQVWLPALKAAKLDVEVRMHDMRHAHASWFRGRRRPPGRAAAPRPRKSADNRAVLAHVARRRLERARRVGEDQEPSESKLTVASRST
jgi:hypothetical protein